MFSFFKKESPEEKVRRERNAAAVAALENGELPPFARHRIENHLSSGKNFFSSELSVNEYLLAKEGGMEVIGQVMGTSFYHIRWIQRYGRSTGEIKPVSESHTAARNLALSRLEKEAALLGAHGVIGVKLRAGKSNYSDDMVEFTALGTAVRIPGFKGGEKPFTCDLSGQEFWQLHKAGYQPVSIAFGVCAYYIWTDPDTWRLLHPWLGQGRNQEVSKYTQGFYDSREIAMSRMQLDMESHGAEGCVAVTMDPEIHHIEYESNNRTYHDVLINVTALGTSIKKVSEPLQTSQPGTLMCINVGSGRIGQIGGFRLDELAGNVISSGYENSSTDSDDEFDDD